MKVLKYSLVLASAIMVTNIYAEDLKVKELDLKQGGKGVGVVSVKLSGNLVDNPDLNVNGKSIELKIPNAHIGHKLLKTIGNINLSATQFDRNTVKVVAQLPISLAGKESLVNITLKDNAVDLNFPSIGTFANVSRSPSVKNAINDATNNKEAEKLDENYLRNLEVQNEKVVTNVTAAEVKTLPIKNKIETKLEDKNIDRVKLTQSGTERSRNVETASAPVEKKSSFSVAGYIGKFVAFLALMLLGFYGVLTLFKKGVIKKGKLGFLHSTKLVEVLSTTHVAPKKSLIMVKAHKQIFLISSTDAGMQLISEINDVAGLIKTGEAEITGSNFDSNLITANKTEKEFKLKEEDYVDYESLDEMLNEAPIETSLTTNAAKAIEKKPVKDQVKLSDQIKTKIKNLKQLQ